MSEPNRGAVLAREYLRESGQKQRDLAKISGVTDVTALNWLRGNIRPNEARRRVIARWSGGRVPMEAWDETAPAGTEAPDSLDTPESPTGSHAGEVHGHDVKGAA